MAGLDLQPPRQGLAIPQDQSSPGLPLDQGQGYTAVPARGLVPDETLGPTGSLFLHPQGYSTHLNIVTEHPTMPGRFTMIPMLTPNQTDIGSLLRGLPASQQQFRNAHEYARQHALQGNMLPTFNSIPEALQYEQQWHEHLQSQLAPLMPALMNQYGGR